MGDITGGIGSIEAQLEEVRAQVIRRERRALLRINEDNENRAVLAERVPRLCAEAVDAARAKRKELGGHHGY